jgi:hypothetical protein
MTAVAGYTCDKCYRVVLLPWRTLRFQHGWTMARQPDRSPMIPTQHFCKKCTP